MHQIDDPGLPSEYQRVEWIENKNNQYINTGLNAPEDSEITVVFQQNQGIAPYSYEIVFGAYGKNTLIASFAYRKTQYFGRWNNKTTGNISNTWDGNVHTVSLSKNGLVFDGSFHALSASGVGTPLDIFLFTWNYMGSPDYTSRGLRMLRYSVVQSGEKLADMIPCYRKADGKTGMYDLVRKEFFTDGRGGDFLLGADVN